LYGKTVGPVLLQRETDLMERSCYWTLKKKKERKEYGFKCILFFSFLPAELMTAKNLLRHTQTISTQHENSRQPDGNLPKSALIEPLEALSNYTLVYIKRTSYRVT